MEPIVGDGRPLPDWQAIDPSPYGFPSGHSIAATVRWGAITGRYWSAAFRSSAALTHRDYTVPNRTAVPSIVVADQSKTNSTELWNPCRIDGTTMLPVYS